MSSVVETVSRDYPLEVGRQHVVACRQTNGLDESIPARVSEISHNWFPCNQLDDREELLTFSISCM
jgi:hypothetical protein